MRMRNTSDFGGLARSFKMTERVCCGFARVFIWETKTTAFKNIIRASDETQNQFNRRILDERFHLYIEQFKDYKPLLLDRGKYKLQWYGISFTFVNI